ncbi:MAG TPA: ThuA domain-containing protein [Sedimentisphaerales bacterium]|nr:ThuA domain-containing protein [Sedimentisphaerales bacterium]
MKYARKAVSLPRALVSILLAVVVCCCSCGRSPQRGQDDAKKIKVVVVTAGHGFKKEPFFAIFESSGDINYVEAEQRDQSELFEDISGWDYDVIVLYNMTQEISPARQHNLTSLLNRGVGLVALHHSIGAFQQWPEYRKIIGGRFYLNEMEENGVMHGKSDYQHGLDIAVHVGDKRHPITRGMKDFVIHDEAYKKCVFEKGNHVLLTTNHPASDEPLCWVRGYGKARVCYIQLGHDSAAYENENYRRLVSRAIRWSAGRLN